MFRLKDFKASVERKQILKGIDLVVGPGEIHAIMGPNGAGKSTLARALAGHPDYEVEGTIELGGANLSEMEVNERAAKGLFMSFQYPLEIPGLTNRQFLFEALNSLKKARGEAVIEREQFEKQVSALLSEMNVSGEFLDRGVNVGFSGGEKKKCEIIQMALLDPKVIILDETDSGLDIDAIRTVADGVNRFMDLEKSLVMITHYQRLLDYIQPHFVHVMVDGAIVLSGGPELAIELENRGYEWVYEEMGAC